MNRSFVSTSRAIARLGAIAAAVCMSLYLSLGHPFAANAAETAADVPLGLTAQTVQASGAASFGFAADKLGVSETQTMGQKLWSAGASRVLAVPPVHEAPAPQEAAADQAPSDAGSTVTGPESAPEWSEPSYDEPSYDEPAPQEPEYQEPAPQEPEYVEPAPQEPEYEEPAPQEPAYEWYTTSASAYDPVCNGGTATSSGIPLDWTTPTVASIWVPDGAYVEIVYNGISVIAQVTDYGPFIAGRELDLSPGVFTAFGFDSTESWGVRTVTYRVL